MGPKQEASQYLGNGRFLPMVYCLLDYSQSKVLLVLLACQLLQAVIIKNSNGYILSPISGISRSGRTSIIYEREKMSL